MNARTGKLSDYYGEPIKEDESTVYSYSDLTADESGFADKVNELKYYGIKLKPIDGKFSPNTPITGEEYYNIISYYTRGSYSNTDFDGLDKSKEPISFRNAAKVFTIKMGAKSVAELKGIYIQIFTDIPASDPDVGYINIATAMGLHFNDGNAFLPDNKVTRAQAINLIYEFLDK
jgi:hypothetical protein